MCTFLNNLVKRQQNELELIVFYDAARVISSTSDDVSSIQANQCTNKDKSFREVNILFINCCYNVETH